MRLFVGVALDEGVRQRAAALASALRARLERAHQFQARWSDPANLHLTLAFIGDVEEAVALAIRGGLDRPLDVAAFQVQLGGFGAFPPSGPPRVVWLGVTSGAGPLAQLHDEVEGRLRPFGYEPEGRPYSAHLTLARARAPRGPRRAIDVILREMAADAGGFRVTHATLFRSRLSPGGATHEALLRVPLA